MDKQEWNETAEFLLKHPTLQHISHVGIFQRCLPPAHVGQLESHGWGRHLLEDAASRAPWRNICINSQLNTSTNGERMRRAENMYLGWGTWVKTQTPEWVLNQWEPCYCSTTGGRVLVWALEFSMLMVPMAQRNCVETNPLNITNHCGFSTGRKKKWGTVCSGLSQKDLEHFGGNLIVPRKGKEALSDPQVCVVSQNLSWFLWQVGGNEVYLMKKILKKARNVKNKDHRSWGRKETEITQRIPFQRKTS